MTFTAPGSRYIYAIDVVTADKDENTDATTGISNVKSAESKVATAKEGIYDLTGRRVTTMQKGGLYIVNGRKVIF